MRVERTKNFKKQYKKLPPQIQQQFIERMKILVIDPGDPMLRVHPLRGKYTGYWSMNVTGDIRALYREDGDTIVIFAFIGTHSQLFG
jgi:addiction module RelE/StbE family toxin